MTRKIHEVAVANAAPTTTVETVSATTGPHSIESHFDEVMTASSAVEWVVMREAEFDAFVFACYGDHPAVAASREITCKPVIGIAEASMVLASLLGHRFSIITTSPRWRPMLQNAVLKYGFTQRCASVRSSRLAVLDFDRLSPDQVVERLVHEARESIEQDGAEVICLGGAAMAGLQDRVRAELNVPVVEGVSAAIKLAELLVQLGLTTSKLNTYRHVTPRQTTNLSQMFRAVYGES
jgi:allantoin racemase